MKFYYLRRHDGSTVEIPERDLHSTLKRNKSWTLITDEPEPEQPNIDVSEFQCPLCEFVAKSKLGFLSHKRSHK